MSMIKAGIVGSAGYTGGELIRILLRHPQVQLRWLHSRSHAGQSIEHVHRDLLGETELVFTADRTPTLDVIFLCLGHGEANKWLRETSPSNCKIIDLSQDFRLDANTAYQNDRFVYGLPEMNRQDIKHARLVANPGCFATAIQLALLPLAQAGVLRAAVHVTGITGATGAGQQLQPSLHFPWRADNISPYKTLEHQHLKEINQSLGKVQNGKLAPIHFIPWRGDFTRGIFVSCCVPTQWSQAETFENYSDFYQIHAFTHVSEGPIDLKQVVNTNKCLIQTEVVGDQLVVHAAIDNLLKGASGQAVQNMNLMFGLDETTGLHLKATNF